MKTRKEMESEARRLEQRMRESRGEPVAGAEIGVAVGGVAPATLFTFPESSVRFGATEQSGGPYTHRMLRHVDGVDRSGSFEYRLIEEEFVSDSEGRDVRHYEPIDLTTSESAFDVVSAGFRRLDEDRLFERVAPIVAHCTANGFTTDEWNNAVSRIQQLASDLDLSVASQMRVKSDAIDLLEGRLELGDFVARAVERQECFRDQRVTLSRTITESIEV